MKVNLSYLMLNMEETFYRNINNQQIKNSLLTKTWQYVDKT